MRKAGRFIVLFFASLLSTAVLGAAAALMAAVSLAATALIVPGTGTPDANVVENYMENAENRYLAPFSDCSADTACTLEGINYPASFFPFVIFRNWCVPGRCEKWNTSVGEGVDALYDAIDPNAADGEYVVFGYSQGGAVVSNALRRIAKEDPDLFDKIGSVVLIGNAYNPDGGLFTRLGFLPTIPFFNITFGPATPTNTGLPMTSIGFEYDPVVYAPRYWGNLLALANAFAAFDNVHGYYLTPNGNGPHDSIAYGYTEAELAEILATECPGAYCRVDKYGNEYYMIPAKSLPLMNLIRSVTPDLLKPIVEPLINLTSPVAKVLIDLAYNWDGDPSRTVYMSLLPFSPSTNWLKVGIDLAAAVVQGISDMINGGPTIAIPADEADAFTLAARSSAPETRPALNVVRDDEDDDVVEEAGQKSGEKATAEPVVNKEDETEPVVDEDEVTEEEIGVDEGVGTDPEGTKDDEDEDIDPGDLVTDEDDDATDEEAGEQQGTPGSTVGDNDDSGADDNEGADDKDNGEDTGAGADKDTGAGADKDTEKKAA
ncbi:PE-PPE domain-containing protein [Mycolicibacterium phlei]